MPIPLKGDRSAWDADNYPALHASDMAAGDSHHPVLTLGATGTALLALVGQALGLNTQAANTVLAGPVTGAAAAPTMRALVVADLPAHTHEAWQPLTNGDATTPELIFAAGDVIMVGVP